MSPWRAALLGAAGNFRIVVELVVPDHVVERAVVDLVERRADRVRDGVAGAPGPRLQGLVGAAGEGELLAPLLVALHAAAEDAGLLGVGTAMRKRLGVELEHEPPVGRLARVEIGCRRLGGGATCEQRESEG